MLEHCDAEVHDAVSGKQSGLIPGEVTPQLLEQSREEYLRYAIALFDECLAGSVHDADRAVAALDVLCVMFDDE